MLMMDYRQLLRNIIRKNPRHILAEKKARLKTFGFVLQSNNLCKKKSSQASSISDEDTMKSTKSSESQLSNERYVQPRAGSGYDKIDFFCKYM